MAEGTQAAATAAPANAGADSYEQRYKELQAEFTRKSQQLAEYERMRQEGNLVNREEYDRQWQEHVAKQARENPEEFAASIGWNYPAGQTASSTSAKLPGAASVATMFPGFDESIYEEGSEAQKRFVQKYGSEGWETAFAARWSPQILKTSGVDVMLEEQRRLIEEQRKELEAIQEQQARALQYAEEAWRETRYAGDPTLKRVREEQERAKKDPKSWWAEQIALRDKLQALEAKAHPANSTDAQRASPDDQAARIQEAQNLPASAGAAAGSPDSRPADPLERALHDAAVELGIAR